MRAGGGQNRQEEEGIDRDVVTDVWGGSQDLPGKESPTSQQL